MEAALDAGQITMAEVNEAVYRYLYSIFRLGLWNVQLPSAPAANTSTPQSDPASAAALAATANYAIVLGYYDEREGSDLTNISLADNGDAPRLSRRSTQPP
ncbi:MAG: hypothetical protein ACRDZX_04155 [Acidimicrobiales bacterium]